MDAWRVEWLSVDHEGAEHRYISHDMPQVDAQAMAATLRKGKARDVVVLQRAE